MKKQRLGLRTETTCCMTDGDPWSVKPNHWKSEAKDHQLSPVDEELRYQPTKLNRFRSGQS